VFRDCSSWAAMRDSQDLNQQSAVVDEEMGVYHSADANAADVADVAGGPEQAEHDRSMD
jgi:hypothetical protein